MVFDDHFRLKRISSMIIFFTFPLLYSFLITFKNINYGNSITLNKLVLLMILMELMEQYYNLNFFFHQ